MWTDNQSNKARDKVSLSNRWLYVSSFNKHHDNYKAPAFIGYILANGKIYGGSACIFGLKFSHMHPPKIAVKFFCCSTQNQSYSSSSKFQLHVINW